VHHLLRHVQGETASPTMVDEITVKAVRDFIHGYLTPHARRIYRHLGRSPAYHGARRIAAWIVARQKVEFVARDIRQKEWAGLTAQDDVNRALDYLEHVARWVRSREPTTGLRGGRPTTRYEVNPVVVERCTAGRGNGFNGAGGISHAASGIGGFEGFES